MTQNKFLEKYPQLRKPHVRDIIKVISEPIGLNIQNGDIGQILKIDRDEPCYNILIQQQIIDAGYIHLNLKSSIMTHNKFLNLYPTLREPQIGDTVKIIKTVANLYSHCNIYETGIISAIDRASPPEFLVEIKKQDKRVWVWVCITDFIVTEFRNE